MYFELIEFYLYVKDKYWTRGEKIDEVLQQDSKGLDLYDTAIFHVMAKDIVKEQTEQYASGYKSRELGEAREGVDQEKFDDIVNMICG